MQAGNLRQSSRGCEQMRSTYNGMKMYKECYKETHHFIYYL